MHALSRIIEKVPHDPLMIAFCDVITVIIGSVLGMWIATGIMTRVERRRHHGR